MANAFLGNREAGIGHTFKFNPDSVEWGYLENIAATDTLGGRVYQLLSVKTTDMSFAGVAGSRGELQRLAKSVIRIMRYHVRSKLPVDLLVPSRRWHFQVYVIDLPNVGWDAQTVSYPYQMSLMISEDFGIKTQQIAHHVLNRLAKDIGYDPTWHGGNPQAFQDIISGLVTAPTTGGSGGGGGTGDGPASGNGSFVAAQALKAVGCPRDKAITMVAIAGRESSWDSQSHTYGDPAHCGSSDCGKRYPCSAGTCSCEDSWGFWQINRCAWSQFSAAELATPMGSATAAKQVSSNFTNFDPWSSYKAHSYDSFIPEAKRAVEKAYR